MPSGIREQSATITDQVAGTKLQTDWVLSALCMYAEALKRMQEPIAKGATQTHTAVKPFGSIHEPLHSKESMVRYSYFSLDVFVRGWADNAEANKEHIL